MEVENVILPASRALHYFERGEVDALGIRIDGYAQLNKNSLMIKTKVLGNSITRAWVLKKRKKEILSRKEISYVVLLGEISPKIYQLKTGVKIDHSVSTVSGAIKMLLNERVDAYVTTDKVLRLISGNSQFTPLNDLKTVHTLHHYIHSSKKYLLKPLNNEFKKASESGIFKTLARP